MMMMMSQRCRGKSRMQNELKKFLLDNNGVTISDQASDGVREHVIEYQGRTFCFVSSEPSTKEKVND